MGRLFLFLAFLAFGGAASAQEPERDWWWIGEFSSAPNRIEVYVDRNSVRQISKNVVEAWVYWIQETPFANGEVMAVTLTQIDCRARTNNYTARLSFNDKGEQLNAARVDGLPAERIRPNTSADVLRRYLCRDRPMPSIASGDPVGHAMKMFGRVPPEPAAQSATEEEAAPRFGTGTGFFVNGSGHIVTSYHVIADANRIIVITPDGADHEARVIRFSEATDLAVLAIDYAPKHFLTLAPPNISRSGDRVFTFGFPAVMVLGWEPKYTDGAISALSGIGNEAAYAQISIPVQPGNSGGPIVNERGQVVGVVASGAEFEKFREFTGSAPQNVNWAVRGEYVAPLIQPQPSRVADSREEAVDLARNSVVLIVVEK